VELAGESGKKAPLGSCCTCYEAVAEEELVELAGEWGEEAAHRTAEVPVMRP
jgi:hypothetical protein